MLFIFLFSQIVFSQTKHSDVFYQDVATVYTSKDGLPETVISKIILSDTGMPIAISNKGAVILNDGKWISYTGKMHEEKSKTKIQAPTEAGQTYKMISYLGYQVLAAQNGLYSFDEETKQWHRVLPADHRYSWSLSNVKVMIVDSKNRLWFGSDQGIGYKDKGKWHLFTGMEGLPYKKFTCIEADEKGNVWFGTEKGVFRTDGKSFAYRFSRRWLPNDYVNDMAVQKDGIAWIATNGGISKIESIEMTFEQKADYFTQQVEKRHNRMGFIAHCSLKERYNIDSWTHAISDNDGLYTAMYGAAQAFRYAVTREKEAKELATRSFNACKWLVDITHEKGFPARVIIPVDWPEPVNEQYGREYNKRKQKEDPFWKDISPRFPLSKDGKYRWKCDTSSDELSGHYFYYAIYYDLVAETEAEKEPVREVVRDVTDHLIRHGFLLRDHDGKPTRWANFSPEFFNSIWGWDQRGLNSMMMLSFLNVAWHVTGDKKYLKTAEMLREKHHYHINAMQSKMFFPPEDVVPWDNNLCLMSMYGLLNYETDPELIMMYRESLDNSWLHISRQKSAYWNTIYAALAKQFNEKVDSGMYNSSNIFPEAKRYAKFTAQQFYKTEYGHEDIIETLQKIPLDLIGYRMDNRHRLDIEFDPTPGQIVNEGWRPHNPERPDNTFELAAEQKPNFGWHVNRRALPIDERCHVRLDRDGFALDATEGSGYSEHEGTFYLLPYYMARYHGIIK
jgi:hypothetical protein